MLVNKVINTLRVRARMHLARIRGGLREGETRMELRRNAIYSIIRRGDTLARSRGEIE